MAEDTINMSKSRGAQGDDSADASTVKSPPKTYAPFDKPSLVPIDRLYARDNSGGPEYAPDTANFGDGGNKKGQGIGG